MCSITSCKSSNGRRQTSVAFRHFFPSTLSGDLMTQVKPCGSHRTAQLQDGLWIYGVPFRRCQTLQTPRKTNTRWTHPSLGNSLMVMFLFIQLFGFLCFSSFFFQPGSNAISLICYHQVLSVERPFVLLWGQRSPLDVALLRIWKTRVFFKGYWCRCLHCRK